MTFTEKVKDLINLFDNWLLDPQDNTQLIQWKYSAEYLAYTFEFNDTEQIYIDKIISMYEEQFTTQMEEEQDQEQQNQTQDKEQIKEKMDALLNRKQVEQRTPEWYAQMTNIISASEIGNLFAAPRQRAKMVVSKTIPYQPRNQPLAVTSDRMSAFDWGIRFEPVVKQIYEYKYEAVIKELGRLYNPIDPRCAASPDGLIYYCSKKERMGRLIEIKCPVTREIDGKVPKDYYSQMQMQLHVTGLEICDYVEGVFSSKYNNMDEKTGPGLYNGYIAVMRKDDVLYYEYSPVNVESWNPEGDVIEIIPWKLMQWGEQIVVKSDEWWTSIVPIMNTFWEDVEKAKRGEFTVPESTRKRKEEPCKIIFNKLDAYPVLLTGIGIESPL